MLNELSFFCPIESTCIDYMHSVFLGAVKTLFKYWFESNSSKPYSLKNKINEIDSRLLRIRPTSQIAHAPRSILSFNIWRAHEFMNFILFFAIPVFYKVMKREYFKNLICLIISLEHLVDQKISKNKLPVIKNMLVEFVSKLENLYDNHIMNSGIHELLHLADCTKNFGPLNAINCFQFEELNRKVERFHKGQDLVGEEFLKLWNSSQNLGYFLKKN